MENERVQRIRERAHALWEEAGRPHGSDAEHWAQAEREIAADDEAQSSAATTGRRGRESKAVTEDTVAAPRSRRGSPPEAEVDPLIEASTDAPRATRARKPKASSDDGPQAPKARRGHEPQAAAADEGDAPRPKRGRKPKVVAEGSDTAE